MATKGKEMEKAPESVDLERVSPAIRSMVETIVGGLEVEDAFSATFSIIDRILSAESEEDVFAGLGALDHARDELLGIPIEVTSVRWNASTFHGETNVGFYCIFDYVNLYSGEKRTASVGSLNCMAQLYQLDRLGKLPYPIVLSRTEQPTKSGFYPLFFRPISENDRENIAERGNAPIDVGNEPAF